MKRKLKTVLRIVMRSCKIVSKKQCINREANIRISQFNYSVNIVEIKKKFIAVVTPPYIYHSCFTWKTLWKEKFTPASMRSRGSHNVKKK